MGEREEREKRDKRIKRGSDDKGLWKREAEGIKGDMDDREKIKEEKGEVGEGKEVKGEVIGEKGTKGQGKGWMKGKRIKVERWMDRRRGNGRNRTEWEKIAIEKRRKGRKRRNQSKTIKL